MSKVGRWSKSEDDYILENYRVSADCKVIGSHLNRSPLSVLVRYKRLADLGRFDQSKQVDENKGLRVDNKEAGKVNLMNLKKVIKFSFPASSLSDEVDLLSRTLLAVCSGASIDDLFDVSVTVQKRQGV